MTKDGLGYAPRGWIGFFIFAGVLSAAFSLVLIRLIRFSFDTELASYVPLIPFISAYLLYLKCRRKAALPESAATCRRVAFGIWTVAGGLLIAQGVLVSLGRLEGAAAALVLPILAYVTGLMGGAVYCFGLPAFMNTMFPWLFLYWMVPIPEPVAHGLRMALQQGSAEATAVLFMLTGTPVFRDGITFHLPGLTIQVAEECCGINSSLVLLITSMVAGHLFLTKAWCRALLVLVVVPLGLFRNGFRIVSLSLLTIHVNPGILDSPLHHRGGPVFFALSLVVFVAILWGLRAYERKRSR
jgi:exosortase C (VPDSG-CTERM-specific)